VGIGIALVNRPVSPPRISARLVSADTGER
jgi:hypothetical protein